MNRPIAIIVFSFFLIHASTGEASYQEIAQRIQLIQCEARALGAVPPKPAGSVAPAVMGRWEAVGRFLRLDFDAFGERAAQQADRTVWDDYQHFAANLQRAQAAAMERMARAAGQIPVLDPNLQPLARELEAVGIRLIPQTQSPGQLEALLETIQRERQNIIELSLEIRRQREEIGGALQAQSRELRASRFDRDLQLLLSDAQRELASATTVDARQALQEAYQTRINDLVRIHRAEEILRRELEMRADPASRESVAPMLAALGTIHADLRGILKLEGQSAIDALLREARIGAALNESAELRTFLQNELQMVRRLLELARAQDPTIASEVRARLAGGALLRLENSLRALQSDTTGSSVRHLQSIRASVRSLTRPRMLVSIPEFRGLRRLNLLEREALVQTALGSMELRMSLFGAAIPLRTRIDSPVQPLMEQVSLPSRPVRPAGRVSASAARAYNAQARAYNLAVQRLQAADASYRAAVANYNDTLIPEYNRLWAELREAHDRRNEHRFVLVAFIARYHSEFFADPQIPRDLLAYARARTEARMANLPPVRQAQIREQARARHAAERQTEERNRDESDGMDFFLAIYTGNPMWLVNRDVAAMQMLWQTGDFTWLISRELALMRHIFDDVLRHSTLSREEANRAAENLGVDFGFVRPSNPASGIRDYTTDYGDELRRSRESAGAFGAGGISGMGSAMAREMGRAGSLEPNPGVATEAAGTIDTLATGMLEQAAAPVEALSPAEVLSLEQLAPAELRPLALEPIALEAHPIEQGSSVRGGAADAPAVVDEIAPTEFRRGGGGDGGGGRGESNEAGGGRESNEASGGNNESWGTSGTNDTWSSTDP